MATVVLAIGLSGVGVALALHQVRSTTIRVMAQAKLRAAQIAQQASDRAQQAIDTAVRSIGELMLLSGSGSPPSQPPHMPPWVNGAMSFRQGPGIARINPATPEATVSVLPPGGAAFVEHVGTLVTNRPGDPLVRSLSGRTELHFERVADQPIIVAWRDMLDANALPVSVMITVDSRLLAEELLDPILIADQALELTPASRSGGPWDQPLPGALRHWSIRPAERFVREQRGTVLGQTLAYVGLTSLALIALLAALWTLVRAVRREVALAELKSNFVADVSHELKTPLALIRLYAETLQSGRVPTDEKRREYYDVIARESTRLTNLINNILDFARIEAGRREYTLAPIDAAEVVRQTYEAYKPQLEQAGFEHHLNIAPSLPQIDADRDAVSQILVNLITNAIKYSPDERHLLIEMAADVRRGRRGILISVHDRGIGIQPSDREFLTDGFYRARDAQVRQQGGAGLGLALVRHIVEIHGGSMDIESRLVKGSTFRVFLPASGTNDARSATLKSE